MEHSYFLGQLIGTAIALFAIAGLLKPNLVKGIIDSFNPQSFSAIMAGFMAMLGGIALILSHNIWDGTWRVMITIIGWGALIKGWMYLVMPDTILTLGKKVYGSNKNTRLVLIIAFIFGFYLAAKGFGH